MVAFSLDALWRDDSGEAVPDVEVGVSTHRGLVREKNEDAYGHFSDPERDAHLFVVADGMGGHDEGQRASRIAVETIAEIWSNTPAQAPSNRLNRAFSAANRAVRKEGQDVDGARSMGTTATALVLLDETAHLAHVGDSRAYLIRDRVCRQLSRDHTVVEKMRREKLIGDEEAQNHPRRGELTRAIGVQDRVEVDVKEYGGVEPGDRFILCSDGAEDLSQETLTEIVMSLEPQAASEQLVERANDVAGTDNVTVLVIEIGSK